MSWSILQEFPFWALFGLTVIPMAVMLPQIIQFWIKPRLIPKSQINQRARMMIEHDGVNAAELANLESSDAWQRGDWQTAGTWQRVEREILRRSRLSRNLRLRKGRG
jgi:hypothetical protein